MIDVAAARKLCDEVEARAGSGTEGPWFYNSYGGVFSSPKLGEYNAAEALIPDDASDDDPRWVALPEAVVASVPPVAGDTAVGRHAADARFIAAARTDVPSLASLLREALDEIERLKTLVATGDELITEFAFPDGVDE